MKNPETKFYQHLARIVAALDSVGHSDKDVELNLALFYGVESAFHEFKAAGRASDTEYEVATWGPLAALEIFCRSVRLLLGQGLDPQELRSKVDPQDQFRYFCEMCADSLRKVLEADRLELKQAA